MMCPWTTGHQARDAARAPAAAGLGAAAAGGGAGRARLPGDRVGLPVLRHPRGDGRGACSGLRPPARQPAAAALEVGVGPAAGGHPCAWGNWHLGCGWCVNCYAPPKYPSVVLLTKLTAWSSPQAPAGGAPDSQEAPAEPEGSERQPSTGELQQPEEHARDARQACLLVSCM